MSIPEPTEADFRHDIPHAYEMACVMLSEKGPFDSFIMGILRRAHHAESQVAASVRDAADDHTHLQALCRAAGVPEQQVTGDSHGVPGIGDLADLLAGRLAAMTAARDKLQAFKDWTHAYLDSHAVPHHPPGTHGAEGCRIGDRMDWLMSRLAALRAEVERLRVREAELVDWLAMGERQCNCLQDLPGAERCLWCRRAAALIKEPDHA